jgi:uncharacterized protein (TIGR02996 family)
MDGDTPAPHEQLLASLAAALETQPDDVALRLHYAQLLDEAGRRNEAVQQAAVVLQQEPTNSSALALISGGDTSPATRPETRTPLTPEENEALRFLDSELNDVVPPMFIDSGDEETADEGKGDLNESAADFSAWRVENACLTLADVGGMTEVKARLNASVLAPMRNPELGRLYGKSLNGGLLLYGPPGCGKTFIARALAGEIGANFLAVSLADVLTMWLGQSERNIKEVFEIARANSPCVLFFDEIDALGQKRSNMRGSAGRGVVNQLLTEMDGINNSANEGVFVLGATNHPWDVDVALRRPGRFDRMLLVLPPDEDAREHILRLHLQGRPIANIDVRKIAKQTEGYSGADLAQICNVASERALLDSVASGTVRLIEMRDVEGALKETRSSIDPWLQTASNVAQFANQDGSYDDLKQYLRKRKVL